MESRVGHFQVEEVLGRGGMGVVYRATDVVLERTVALKTMLPDVVSTRSRRARFLREARAAAAVTHPNVATVYEVGEDGDTVYIAMEFIAGETLQDLIAEEQLELSGVLEMAIDIARALAAAHRAGVVHRDLKPANVMVDASGQVKLLDFGLAKTLRPTAGGDTDLVTAESAILGTPAYMSPEQCRGRPADARSDVFSFGTLLYELVAGERPFSGDSHPELGIAIMNSDPEPLESVHPGVPTELASIVARCLEKEPDDRYQDGEALAADLKEVRLAEDAAASRSVARPARAAAGRSTDARSRRRTWPLVVVALVAIAAASWIALRGDEVTEEPSPPTTQPTPEPAASRPRSSMPRDVQLTAFSNVGRVYANAGARADRTFAYGTFEGLWLASIDGGPPRKVEVHGEYAQVWPIDFFPEGERLLVELNRGSEALLGILEIESGEATLVHRGPFQSARLSPDGSRIVFKEERGLYVTGVDGKDRELVVPFAADEDCLVQTWSPDGRYIAFIRDRWSKDGWKTVLEITAADGSARATLPTVGHLNNHACHAVDWVRPERIIYATTAEEGTGSELWSIGVVGGAWDGRPGEMLYSWPDVFVDYLHPFGSELLYLKNSAIETDVWVAELAGDRLRTEPVRLTQHERMDLLSGWTRDGKALFTSNRHGTWDVFAQSVGGSPETVAAGPDDESGAIQAGSSILFWRVHLPRADEAARCVLVRRDEDGKETELLTLAHAAVPEPGWPPFCAAVQCALRDPGRCVLAEPLHQGVVLSVFDPREPVLMRRPIDAKNWGALSPDGRSVAGVARPNSDGALVLTDLETGAIREVRYGVSLRWSSLDWRPDRPGWLLMGRDGDSGVLLAVAPDGSSERLWSRPGGFPTINVLLSPDGRYVGFGDRTFTTNVWMLEDLDL